MTSGGDCQGLNAALRGVGKALFELLGDGVTIYGIREGYRGLMENIWMEMKPSDFSGILTLGGTILGTSRQPFKRIGELLPDGSSKIERMKETYRNLGLDCLVILGGNGSHKTARALSDEGLSIITLPKTIDNDLYGTDVSFGFQSAVDNAALVIDSIHSTAISHGRVFIIELMGHHVGFLTLHAGIAAGADVILLPEIPYDPDAVAQALNKRTEAGKRFSILAVSEGAMSKREASMSKKERKEARARMTEPSISYRVAREIEERTGKEIRVAVPGHFQRGGAPCAFDRMLASRFGTAAARLIKEENYGNMVALRQDKVVPVPLSEVAGKLKTVPPDCEQVQCARDLGISLGDR